MFMLNKLFESESESNTNYAVACLYTWMISSNIHVHVCTRMTFNT